MPDDNYSVKINRRDGIVEITGPDKDWIAEQLTRLAVVYEGEPESSDGGADSTTPLDGDGERGGKSTPKTRSRRTGGGGAQRAKKVPDLEAKLTREVRNKLEAYVAERQKAFDGSRQDQAAIIATFLEDELQIDWIGRDELYTVYAVMGWPSAVNIRAQLDNAKIRNGYFGGWVGGRVQLTQKGENFGRHESKSA